MDYRDKEKIISPDHKVGIKILNDTQMMNVFPDYASAVSRIEKHRKWLVDHQIQSFTHYQYNLMYDNVISIFGKRGTGKTSVAFTLHKKIEEDSRHAYDVVLPIIIPEVIPDDGSVLGWLLAIVHDQVSDFEKEYWSVIGKQDYETGYADFWKNCKREKADRKGDSLAEELDRLVELFYAAKYNPANESSYNLAVGNSVKQSQNYYRFAKEIMRFWDKWILWIKEMNETKGSGQEKIAPLIYFIFDDVDLAPQKAGELLSVIIKYLSHPNIVVITTADEEMFLEVIEKRLDRDIGRLPKEWRDYLNTRDVNGNAHDKEEESRELVKKTARRYLGKVMPTSTRYYLKQFNTVEEKRLFYLDDDKELWTGICEQVGMLLGYLQNPGVRENFLVQNQVDRDYYLNFLGNTSRQLGNVYIGIKDFIGSLVQTIASFNEKSLQQQDEGHEKYVEMVYHSAWRFLYVSINSNHDLAERIEDVESFINEIFWMEHDGWLLYINYTYLDDCLRRKLSVYSATECVKMALQLYSLLQFVENIFLILEDCTERGITGRKRIHGLSNLREFLCDQVFHGDAKLQRNLTAVDFFAHYKTLLNRLGRLMEEGIHEKKLCKEYLYDFSGLLETVPDDFISWAFRKDRDWLQEICGMLSATYGNLYLIGTRELKNCRLYEEWESLSRYQTAIKDLLEDDIYQTLDEFYLLGTAKEEFRVHRKLFEQMEDGEEDSHSLREEHIEEFHKRICQKIKEHAEETQIISNEKKTAEEGAPTFLMEPVTALIQEVNNDLAGKSIGYVIELLPDEEGEEVKSGLSQEQTGNGILTVLKVLYDSISEWDMTARTFSISEIMNIYSAADDDSTDSAYQKEFNKLASRLTSYIPAEYEEQEGSWYLMGGSLYREIKECLNRVKYACIRGRYITDAEYIEEQIKQIERELEVSFNADDAEEFQSALYLAVRVHLAVRMQRLYLYYSVVEKYNMDPDYSSEAIEYSINDSDGEIMPTYYFQLFQQMCQLVEKDYSKLSKERKMIRRLIERAASQYKKEYIKQILQEVKHESFPD
ncbi:hypothetical protein B5F29_01190 [Lachnoclostridium sp. An196]|uniref:hypothetical protein n=1 Tax=Lachnoclostridium sp. An196 TaxID=1965583 RepID=UPI000B375496|nr:hypothetical protein [Lachnoclostridium sp. An196]OUP22385.1 hypothetical protein B5F29_01190 [Lachnoclostridium sp. An196]